MTGHLPLADSDARKSRGQTGAREIRNKMCDVSIFFSPFLETKQQVRAERALLDLVSYDE